MWSSQKLALGYMVGRYVILSVFVCLKIGSKLKSEKDNSTNHRAFPLLSKRNPKSRAACPPPPLACSGPSGLLAGPSCSCSAHPASFPSNVCPLLTFKSQLKCPFFKGLSCSWSQRGRAPHLRPLSAPAHVTAFSPFPFSLSEIFLLKILLLCLLCYNAKRRSY